MGATKNIWYCFHFYRITMKSHQNNWRNLPKNSPEDNCPKISLIIIKLPLHMKNWSNLQPEQMKYQSLWRIKQERKYLIIVQLRQHFRKRANMNKDYLMIKAREYTFNSFINRTFLIIALYHKSLLSKIKENCSNRDRNTHFKQSK